MIQPSGASSLHESDGIMSFPEVPFVQGDVDAGLTQRCSKVHDPLLVLAVGPTVRNEKLRGGHLIEDRNCRVRDDFSSARSGSGAAHWKTSGAIASLIRRLSLTLLIHLPPP